MFRLKLELKISYLNKLCVEIEIVIEGLLKRQHTRVKYFQGSLMNAQDLERAKVSNKGFHDCESENIARCTRQMPA